LGIEAVDFREANHIRTKFVIVMEMIEQINDNYLGYQISLEGKFDDDDDDDDDG
jgi:hypothetical protein